MIQILAKCGGKPEQIFLADFHGPANPKNAKQVTAELKVGDPAIYTREYRANEGIIEFDIRAVDQAEMDLIVNRLKEILA